MTLALMFAMPEASAASGLHVEPFNIEPGQSKTVGITLDNASDYTGFQFQLALPLGLEVVESASRTFSLTSRADSSHSVTFKHLENGEWRLVCFSSKNTPFTDGSGPIVEFQVRAASDFPGGEISLTDIHCSDISNKDVAMPDTNLAIGTQEVNRVSMSAFDIYAGQTLDVELSLKNESVFTAFQLDITVPEGLSIVSDSFSVAPRGGSDHSVSYNDMGNGRTRVVCFSTSNATFNGNSGALLSFKVKASEDCAVGSKEMEISNILFTRPDGRELSLSNIAVPVTISRAAIESIEFLSPTVTLKAGQTQLLKVKTEPEYAYSKSILWTSSKTSVATVSEDGTVTAISPGETTITAKAADSDVSASCVVTVTYADVESISVTPAVLSLRIGEKTILKATVLPETSVQTVSWRSDHPEIATVTETGEVTAISLGSAKISAIAGDGTGVTGESIVTVVAIPAEGISISTGGSTTLKASQTVQLTATVTPDNATDKNVIWKSENADVATVSETGLVTAVSVGSATITATNSAGQSASVEITVVATPADGITISAEGPTTLKASQTVQLTATVTPNDATDKSVTWKSENADVATVSETGLVTAVSIGSATITATNSAGQTASIEITVVPTPAEGISISAEGSMTLKASQTVQLTAKVTPDDATDKTVTWKSENTDVATVSETGLVTAVSIGTTTITATNSAGQAASIEITVVATPAEGITISAKGPTTLKASQTVQLTATVTPDDATDKTVTWKSENTDVATVSETGLVTAVSIGSATITATNSAGQTASIEITVVTTPAEGISISAGGSTTLKASQTVQLTATVTPDDATDKSVIWKSENVDVATVSETGLVTAVSIGSATITATNSAGQTASIEITVVTTPAEGISISAGGSTTLKASQTVQLTATVTPDDATDKSVTWKSNNADVATVSETGLVTAVSIGSATITATNSAGQTATIEITVVATPAEGITISAGGSTTLKAKQTVQLSATVTPDDATDKSVTWKSENEDVAIVSETGLVTAVSVGTAVITATNSTGQSASVTIIVEKTLVESISLNNESLTMKIGETKVLSATVLPVTATDKNIKWMSDNEKIVKVSSIGEVTAVSVGVAKITAMATDGSKVSASCTVTVLPPENGEIIIKGVYYRVNTPTGTATVIKGDYTGLETAEIVDGFSFYGIDCRVTSIEERTFYDCTALKEVVIPASIVTVCDEAFYGCRNLSHVEISDGEIPLNFGRYPFSTSYTIGSLYLGRQYTFDKDYNPFYRQPIREIVISDNVRTIPEYMSYGNNELSKLTIGKGVELIPYRAFMDCPSLKEVVIPSSVKEIQSEAFANCILKSVVSENPIPPVLNSSAFSSVTYSNAELRVPAYTREKYISAPSWKNFSHISEEGGSGLTDLPQDDESEVIIYSINGVSVYTGKYKEMPKLQNGIYIITVDGKTRKLIIK